MPDNSAIEKFQFIEFILLFKGQLTRNELVIRFTIGEATASRIIASYIAEHPHQMVFMGSRIGYIISKNFTQYYQHNIEQSLQYLAYGEISARLPITHYGNLYFESTLDLDLNNVAHITRAIVNGEWLEIKYFSTSSGHTTKQIKPHSLFKAGNFWYFRAFDYKQHENHDPLNPSFIPKYYRNLKFSRVIKVQNSTLELSHDPITKERDTEWNNYRYLQLIPHPKAHYPESQMLDLGIKQGEMKEILVPEAIAGFILIDLRVDCSPAANLNPSEYPLRLHNVQELSHIPSMIMAPGFT